MLLQGSVSKGAWKRLVWRIGLWLMGLMYIGVGVTHFAMPGPFVQIVPPYLPWPLALVYLSGVAEIGLGAGVLVERVRRLAAWGLCLLLIAVYPANLYMWTDNVSVDGTTLPGWFRPVRFVWQLLLLAWAWVYTRPRPAP